MEPVTIQLTVEPGEGLLFNVWGKVMGDDQQKIMINDTERTADEILDFISDKAYALLREWGA